MGTKICTCCKLEKVLADFRREKLGRYERAAECRECKIARENRWRAQNLGYNVRYYRANKTREAERVKRWCRENHDQKIASCRIAKGRRRARKLDRFIEDVDRTIVYEMHGGCCGICKDFVSRDDFHVDHIVPLSRGGWHGYANVQPAHPACNLQKWAN